MKVSLSSTIRMRQLLLPTIIAAVLFIPWLGEALFYSKGEPREAIVAVSMLDSGDWILPVSYGEDIPYKPPFMAWLIAICAIVFNGGVVNEFISRLPSALAAIALLVSTWRLIAAKFSTKAAWRVMLILATMFEFFRAAVACRVDMILTTCMIGGLYALYTAGGSPKRILWAILLFSGATLTKGPVGTLLPCLAFGVYSLLSGRNFLKTCFQLTLIALASFILPACWYWLAYQQGGASFGELAWEENIGRLTGTMSYDSHINPWYYNIITLLSGMLPWTVIIVIGAFYKRIRNIYSLKLIKSDFPLFCTCIFFTILIFYCIPASKRSVYLLPCYPFLAVGAGFLLGKLAETRLTRIWAIILAIISVIAPIILIIAQNVHIKGVALANPGFIGWTVAAMSSLAGLWWLFTRSTRANGLAGSIGLTYLVMIAYNSTYMPAAVNPKSDRHIAQTILNELPENAKIESEIPQDRLLRYYSLNFYLGDRIRRAETSTENRNEVWILTSEPNDSSESKLLTNRSADTRQPVYLVYPNN